MKRFRLIGLALVTVFALGAMLSASASALTLPLFLPLTGNQGFKGVAEGTSTLENSEGKKVECTTAEGSGGLESDTLGTFHITFKTCKAEGFACNTEGDSSGLILSEGSLHYVYDTLGTGETLGVAILFLPKETLFTCAGGLVSNKVKGTVLCLIQKPFTTSTTHTFTCSKGTGKGEAGEKKYWNDGGTIVEAQLLSSLNKGTFKESNEQAKSTNATTLAGAWMTA